MWVSDFLIGFGAFFIGYGYRWWSTRNRTTISRELAAWTRKPGHPDSES